MNIGYPQSVCLACGEREPLPELPDGFLAICSLETASLCAECKQAIAWAREQMAEEERW